MEGVIRKPFQGVGNIVRFNWHFYVLACISVLLLLIAGNLFGRFLFWVCIIVAASIIASTIISLLVSFYIYDRSDLYDFKWLRQFNTSNTKSVVNIHAGFDETSSILKANFPDAFLDVFDFYDASTHTEISIERARKAYPAYPGTKKVTTSHLPLDTGSIDFIFNIFAAHEVRNRDERINFLIQQAKALRHNGKVIVVEHLRDLPNFLAYNIGFFHFLSEREWTDNFQQAGFFVGKKFKITPFITVFILSKADGITS